MSENLEELLNNLENIGGNVEEALEKGVLRACQKIQGDAKRLAPVDSGRLRYSITSSVKQEGVDIIGEVGTNVDYAAFVEFGTGPVGKASPKMLPDGVDVSYSPKGWAYHDDDGFKYTKGQPAQPFLYPAFKQNESSVPGIIASTIKQEIRKAME